MDKLYQSPPECSGRPIGPFKHEWAFLSNFYVTPITHLGVEYPTVENAYQAMKAPQHERSQFSVCSASVAKRLGRRFQLPYNWNNDRTDIMAHLVRHKFSGVSALHQTVRARLINTEARDLIEINWWHDTFWGVCNGVGENNLGAILRQIRKEIQ